MNTKYKYDCLVVRCWEETIYSPDQLREAVEHLRCSAQTKYTGLMAVTHVQVGDKTVMAMPVIKYAEIVGKTPKEEWSLIDEQVPLLTALDEPTGTS